ncbi:MAG TPA: T9SS type A sorting domain-containing protein [Chryseolinea sp.]|nr:T9SS type A sorting domain-containing protein [Chryseolinea sp.]
MKLLYVLLIFVASAGTAFAQGPTTIDMEQPDRPDNGKAVQIFPNPTTEFVHIRLEHINLDGVKVSMHNIIGNEISIETERIDQHELRIRVKDFDAGYYLLALKDDQSNFKGTYKFLKR